MKLTKEEEKKVEKLRKKNPNKNYNEIEKAVLKESRQKRLN